MINKIKNNVPLDDITKSYNKHKSKFNSELSIGDKVWQDLKYEYSVNYKNNDKFYLEKNFSKEYETHNVEETMFDQPRYEKKETAEFYRLSKVERLKLKMSETIKGMVRFIKHFYIIILFIFGLSINNARNDVKFSLA